LREARFINCPRIRSLAHLMPSRRSLRRLGLVDVGRAKLDSLPHLKALKDLELGGLRQKLPKLEELSELKTFSLRWTNRVDLGGIAKAQQIERLTVGHVGRAKSAEAIFELESLRELRLATIKIKTTRVSKLENLELLGIDLPDLEDIKAFATLPRLNRFELRCYPGLDLKPLEGMTGVKQLTLVEVGSQHLKSIPQLENIRSLVLVGAKLNSLNYVRKFPNLQEIELLSCDGIRSLAPLTRAQHLEGVAISYCRRITDLEPLTQCPELQRVTILPTVVVPEALVTKMVEDSHKYGPFHPDLGFTGARHRHSILYGQSYVV